MMTNLRISEHRGRPCFVWGARSGKRRRVIDNPDNPAAVEQQRISILVEIEGGPKLKQKRLSLDEHVTNHMASIKATERHRIAKEQKIRRVLTAANITHLHQLTVEKVDGAIRGFDMKTRTANHYRKALKQFAFWLYKQHRTDTHQLMALDIVTVRDDTKRIRFEPAEITKLIETAQNLEATIQGFTWLQVTWMLRLAVQTGLRRSELGALTVQSFRLDDDPPVVVLGGEFTKNGRDAVQPVRATPELRQWLSQQNGGVLFPGLRGKNPRKTSLIMRKLMREAGIPQDTPDGRRDWHSARSSFISHLADQGLAVHELMVLARHQDITTSKSYLKPQADLLKRAVNLIPDV